MNTHTTFARLCATITFALFSSTTFAETSQLYDWTVSAGSDFIDWQAYGDPNGGLAGIPSPELIHTDAGMAVTVGQLAGAFSLIYPASHPDFAPGNFPDDDYLYQTNFDSNAANPISFSDFDGMGICSFATEIAPYLGGAFVGRIQAFDAGGFLMGEYDVASAGDTVAFLGISSTEPMDRVQVGLLSEYSGSFRAWYAINQVELAGCTSATPVLTCEGFHAPASGKSKKSKSNENSTLPLMMELFDEDGYQQSDAELLAAPLVMVMFAPADGGQLIDVSDAVTAPGKSADANGFRYKGSSWKLNLSGKGFTEAGEYFVMPRSGDESEYVIDDSCMTSFTR